MAEPRRACPAPAAALAGAQWWGVAVQAVRTTPRAAIDHADLYDVAAELVATLGFLEDLAAFLARSARAYAERDDLRDDDGADPRARLLAAATAASGVGEAIARAATSANAFWSAIGHIGRHYDLGDDPASDGVFQTDRDALDQGADDNTSQDEGR